MLTPEQAQTIYHEASMVEYRKYQSDYQPVNQKKVILAGFQAVIDAVINEQIKEQAEKYLDSNIPERY